MKIVIFINGLWIKFHDSESGVMESVLELLTEDSRYTVIKTQDPNKLKIIGSNSDLFDLIYVLTCELQDTTIVIE